MYSMQVRWSGWSRALGRDCSDSPHSQVQLSRKLHAVGVMRSASFFSSQAVATRIHTRFADLVHSCRAPASGETVEGFIADELAPAVPAAVGEAADGSAHGGHVDHSKLVPLLWAAVQELSAQVREMRAELQAIKRA